jgi:hypothetical protein
MCVSGWWGRWVGYGGWGGRGVVNFAHFVKYTKSIVGDDYFRTFCQTKQWKRLAPVCEGVWGVWMWCSVSVGCGVVSVCKLCVGSGKFGYVCVLRWVCALMRVWVWVCVSARWVCWECGVGVDAGLVCVNASWVGVCVRMCECGVWGCVGCVNVCAGVCECIVLWAETLVR